MRAAPARWLLALALLGAPPVRAIETPPPLPPCGPIARRHEHLEVTVAELGRLGKTPIGRVGVVAMRDGRVVPIPFQVDEREGRQIALPGGPSPSADSKPGVLDPDDLVVALPCDAGDVATPAQLAAAVPRLQTWRALTLEDPLDHHQAHLYVVVADDPPASPRHYVAYEPAADLVSSAAYRIGMVSALPNYFAIAAPPPLGPNLLDGIRLRADATFRGDLAHFHLDEEDAQHDFLAWKTGPVRVVRRSRHDLKILSLGIRLQAATATTAFYPLVVFAPGSIHLPISPAIFFKEISAMGGVDLRDLRGWRFVAPGTPPEGFLIDGVMDDAERSWHADGTWFVLTHDGGAVLVTLTLSENLSSAIPIEVVYVDDATRAAPPELERGSVPLVGFRGRHVERLPADRYKFDLRVYLIPDYHRGDEAHVLRERDAPVIVTVSGPAAPAAAPASAR